MLGFIIGTACLIGLIKVLRHGSCGRWARGWSGGCGGGGCCGGRLGGYRDPCGWGDEEGWGGGPPWARGRGGWGGPGFFLRMIADRLDTTPEQDRVIEAAFRELRDEGAKWRDEGRKTRADAARAVRSEGFDEVLLGETFARHDAAIEAMRRALTGALAKVHAALDEGQRARLADLIERGPGAFGPSRRRRHEV